MSNNTLLTGNQRDEYIAERFGSSLPFTGDDLLTFVSEANASYERQGIAPNKSDMAKAAGYVKDGKIQWTDFYMALMEAKGMPTSDTDDKEYDDWHDSLEEQDSELIDEIQDRCADFSDYTPEECRQFMDELSDIGITTSSQFEDALQYSTDSYNACAEFAEQEADAYGCTTFIDMPWVVIDWEASWERNLRHDYSTIEFKGITYFFHNNF